jgi:WD40 repeat protein
VARCPSPLGAHSHFIALCPCSASASRDAKLLVWQVIPVPSSSSSLHQQATCRILSKPLVTIDEHRSSVDSAAWDPFGHLLASYAQDGELLVWAASGLEAAAASGEEEEGGGSRRRLTLTQGSGGGGRAAPRKPALELAAEFKEPFDGGRAIPALRIDWSPDGSVLAAGNAKAGEECRLAALGLVTDDRRMRYRKSKQLPPPCR